MGLRAGRRRRIKAVGRNQGWVRPTCIVAPHLGQCTFRPDHIVKSVDACADRTEESRVIYHNERWYAAQRPHTTSASRTSGRELRFP